MNFGLTIIAICYIVFLIVPGTFFKRFYFQSKFDKEFYKGAFADRLVTSIFWGLFIQTLCIIIIKFASGLSFDDLYRRINNFYSSLQDNALPRISFNQLLYLSAMFIISICLSCILGHFFHKLLRYFKLDVYFSPLRFSNEWNYIFRNEVKKSDLLSDYYEKAYMTTEVDVIVNDFKEDRPSFYSGILHDYYLDTKGNLDKILLSNARKRIKNEEGKVKFANIKGDIFVIPYCNVANLNLRYNYLAKTRKSSIPKAIQNTITLVLVFLLLPILVVPWFLDVLLWRKIVSMLLMFFAWTLIVGSTVTAFEEQKDKNVKNIPAIILIGISVFVLALYLLDFHYS